jgi:hypothetical protein
MGCIITVRIILAISSAIISISPAYYMAQPCDKVDLIIGKEQTIERYPDCAAFYNGSHPDQNVLVLGNFNGDADEIGTALNLTFGMALWLALFIHALGVEIYVSLLASFFRLLARSETYELTLGAFIYQLQLTPRESRRLREISYSRQLEAGFKNPGRAGLTVDKFGDSEPWVSEKLQPLERPQLGLSNCRLNA